MTQRFVLDAAALCRLLSDVKKTSQSVNLIIGIAMVGAVTASIAAWMVGQVQRDEAAASDAATPRSSGHLADAGLRRRLGSRPVDHAKPSAPLWSLARHPLR